MGLAGCASILTCVGPWMVAAASRASQGIAAFSAWSKTCRCRKYHTCFFVFLSDASLELPPQLAQQFSSIQPGFASHSPLAAQAAHPALLLVHGAGGGGAGGPEQTSQLRRQFSSIHPGFRSHSPLAAQSG